MKILVSGHPVISSLPFDGLQFFCNGCNLPQREDSLMGIESYTYPQI